MKISTNLLWVAGLMIVGAGGFASCESPKSTQENTSPGVTQSPSDSLEEETAPDSVSLLPGKTFDPHAGTIPNNEADYKAALQSIKTYQKENKKAIVTSNYFGDSLIRVLIGKEGSEIDKRVSGLRVYRTYTSGKKGFGVLIVPVDSNGVDLKNSALTLKDGFKAEYLFGISQERCPDNCSGCALN